MVSKSLIAVTAALVLAGCVGTEEVEAVDTTGSDTFGNWTVTSASDPETGNNLLFANAFSEIGSDEAILWVGLLCDDTELEVGFGLVAPFQPSEPLIITTQIEGGPVMDRQGDVFEGDEAVAGFASNDVALAFLSELTTGLALTATIDNAGEILGPAQFDITGADLVAQRIDDECL
ncbi:MAG: hypothetical protein AAF414_18795 [Pseudomonadota bacterium]